MSKFENCFNNMERARTETFSKSEDRVRKIFEELNSKKHNYQNISFDEKRSNDIQNNIFENIFEQMAKEHNNITKNADCYEKNVINNESINWCDTCEGTTLKDCLECVKGNKNPNYNKTSKNIVDDKEPTINLEDHFLKTVKNAKTEDLEKVYDIISEELFHRYLENNNETKCGDSNHTYSQTGDFISRCGKNCSICDKNDPCVKDCSTCSEHKSDNKIQGKIYYKKNEEKPLEIAVDLSQEELKEFKTQIEKEINQVINDIFKRRNFFKHFDF